MLQEYVNMDLLFHTIRNSRFLYRLNESMEEEAAYSKVIYTFKVMYQKDKQCWKTMELESSSSLGDFGMEIHTAFRLEDDMPFVFTPALGNNIEYRLYKNKQAFYEKPLKIPLYQLDLKPEDIFFYSSSEQEDFHLIIKLLKISPGKPGILYPRVLKQSKKITAKEQEFDQS